MVYILVSLWLTAHADPLAASFRVRFTPTQLKESCELQLIENRAPEASNRPSHLVRVRFPRSAKTKTLGALLVNGLSKIFGVEDGRAYTMVERGKENVFDGQVGWVLRRALGRPESEAFPEFTLAAETYLKKWSRGDRELASAALEVLERKAPGQLIWIDFILPMSGQAAVQGQTLKLIVPERTYPRGLIVGADICLPTHRYLCDFTYRAGSLEGFETHGVSLRPAEILPLPPR